MPPKKKGGKGGKAGKGAGGIIDGVSTTEMSRDQLEQFTLRIRGELEREREERNFFQLERDKLRTFWEVTRQQLDENRSALRNKDRELEEAEQEHQMEVKILKQKVKHLMYEHQSNLSELKADGMVTLKMAQEEYTEMELQLLNDKKALKNQLMESEHVHQDELKALKMTQSQELSGVRQEFVTESTALESKTCHRLSAQFNQLTLKHRMELTEVEERKNKQVALLMDNHQQAFSQLKSYYNEITLNNLALISTLKDQMQGMKERGEQTEKNLCHLLNENKRLMGPMQAAQHEVAELQRQLSQYNKDKITLANTKKRLLSITKRLEDLTAEYDLLEMALNNVQRERDELHDRFVTAILELQQKSSLKNLILERKLSALSSALEQREIQVAQVVSAANLDPNTLNNKLEEVLGSKNNKIQELEKELRRVKKAHDDLLTSYQEKVE